jgi:chemotaxis protein histidine kinase CheA
MTDHAHTVAQLEREFRASLPNRLARLMNGLVALQLTPDRQTIEAFYLEAHSLKGTAKAYGADHVALRAAGLSSLAGAWHDSGSLPTADLETAETQLERLREAIEQYRQHIDAGEQS